MIVPSIPHPRMSSAISIGNDVVPAVLYIIQAYGITADRR
jgi:hypothetical protein